MNRTLLIFVLLLISVGLYAGEPQMIQRYNRLTNSWAAYPEVSVQWVQQVHQDSLLVADQLQNTVPARWTLQTSDHMGDTVVVTGLVIVPAKVITYTAKGFTMLLRDTSDNQSWSGLLVRVNYNLSAGINDTAAAIQDGFMNPEAGDIVRITGLISEYPTTSMNSATQFQPVKGYAIEIIGSKALPTPISKNVSDFYTGIFSGGKIWYSKGEMYEGMVVELTNLTIDAKVNTLRGTFSMIDASNNQITMLDASKYFTKAGGTTDHPYPDPIWTAIYESPSFIASKIDTIRGFITINSGSEAARGYRICPLYYGDIVFGKVLPSITTHRRNPIIVPSDSSAKISVRAYTLAPDRKISSVTLKYSVDNAAFVSLLMTYKSSDSTYNATIPQFPENTFVKYFIEAVDDDTPAQMTTLASSAFGGASSDTSKGFFFYNVLNRPLTIQDVQYTPFTNGRTPYLGAVVSLSGIVTADIDHLDITQPSGGTSTWYMQSGNSPWSGIWFSDTLSALKSLRNGDSITVTGSVAEDYDVTKLQRITVVTIHSTGNQTPAPVELQSSSISSSAGNGDPVAESYEGMLVRLNNVTVTSINPTFADPTEYQVDDGSGPVLVQQSRKNSYTNIPGDTAGGKTLIKLGDHISTLTGIIYYSFNSYKFVPRNNADFGTITDVSGPGYDLLPTNFVLNQNYPNPFNPNTNIEYRILNSGYVSLKVFNLLGQEIATLVNEQMQQGTYQVTWDATKHSSGVYFYRLIVNNGEYSSMKRMLLVK
ncbi:MAG: T9SS type A sorting domain-containing protein [Ignavibacteriales bacterium]|nr:T9SS type A sorting domain-containing protein [Ignavibacteriales bacterium]